MFTYGVIKKRLYLLRRNIIRWSILFILIGLSASLPLIITPKQNYNYLIPSLPYFTLGFGVLIVPIINSFLGRIRWREKVLQKITTILGIILLISLIYSGLQIKDVKSSRLINYKYSIVPNRIRKWIFPYAAGRISREEFLISDIHAIGGLLPRRTIISIPESLWEDWNYHAYFARIYEISLDKDNLLLNMPGILFQRLHTLIFFSPTEAFLGGEKIISSSHFNRYRFHFRPELNPPIVPSVRITL